MKRIMDITNDIRIKPSLHPQKKKEKENEMPCNSRKLET